MSLGTLYHCRKVETCHSSVVETGIMLQCDTKLHVISFTSLALIVQMPVAISPRAATLSHLRLRGIRLTSCCRKWWWSQSERSTHPSMVLQGTVLVCRWIWAANHVRSLEITAFGKHKGSQAHTCEKTYPDQLNAFSSVMDCSSRSQQANLRKSSIILTAYLC